MRFFYGVPLISILVGLWYQDPFYYGAAVIAAGLIYYGLHSHIRNNSPIIIIGLFLLLHSTYIGIYKLPTTQVHTFLIGYVYSYITYASTYGWMQILLIWGLYFVAIGAFHHWKKRQTLLENSVQTTIIGLISFVIVIPLSFFLVALHAVGELNVISLKAHSEKRVLTNAEHIAERLITYDVPVQMIGNDYNITTKTIYDAFRYNEERGELYEKEIIPSIPSLLTPFFMLPSENMVLFGRYLLVRTVDNREIQIVIGELIRLLAKDFVSEQYLKENPRYEILDRSDYGRFREKAIDEDLVKLDDIVASEQGKLVENAQTISDLNNEANTYRKEIDSLTRKILSNTEEVAKLRSNAVTVEVCNSKGFSKDYCNTVIESSDWNIKALQQEIDQWSTDIRISRDTLRAVTENIDTQNEKEKELKDGIAYLAGIQKVGEAKKSNSSHEWGIFIPENNIELVLESGTTQSLSDFTENAFHEFLHYTTYISLEKKGTFEPLFEEVLTEYFARNNIKRKLGITTGTGYPLAIKMLDALIKKTGQNEMAQVYLSKDQKQLEELLDKTFGTHFYQEIQTAVRQVYYGSGQVQLNAANSIMKKIKAPLLKEEDALSTRSTVR